jgi:hypothetical protein
MAGDDARPHHLLEEPFCCGNVAFSREHEFNSLALLIDSAIQTLTDLPDFDISLVYSIRRAAHLQMRPDALVDFGSISFHPPEHGRVIYFEIALAHHLFNISVGELISAVPADTQQDDVRRVMAPLER